MLDPCRGSALDTPVAASLAAIHPADDAALAALRSLVNAAPLPMAVFGEDGACLVANRGFVVASAGQQRGADLPATRHAPFSPDGVRHWTLATMQPGDGESPALQLVDAAVNSLPIIFNAKDLHSRYLYMNRYQAALYGVTPDSAVGQTAAEMLGSSYGSYTRAIDAEVIRSARPSAFFEETYAGADQVMRHWMTSKVPLIGPDGAVWGVATVALDITERKQLEERLREARDQAESGSRAKSRFLAAMSHELRTPLNAVIGFAELMQQEALGPLGSQDYIEYAGHILTSGMALLEMITNLLDFARVEAGTLELRYTDVELIRLLRSATAGAQSGVMVQRDPPVAVSLDLPTGHLPIRGDEGRLRQVFGGLIGNALKFTPAGGQVTVRLRAVPGGAEIIITDTGIGMSPDELKHVFEPFWQADSGLSRVRGGAGIGLRLARELVALHGGSVELASHKGQGTQITVLLPTEPQPPGT